MAITPLDPVTALLEVGRNVIDRLWLDPMQATQAKLEAIKLQQSSDLAQISGQMEINKAEAASRNPFTSGWRPFIGWTCGAGFAVQFVVGPVGEWVCALAGHRYRTLGSSCGGCPLGLEPAGAAGLAWVWAHRARCAGGRVATVLCGSNLTAEHLQDILRSP